MSDSPPDEIDDVASWIRDLILTVHETGEFEHLLSDVTTSQLDAAQTRFTEEDQDFRSRNQHVMFALYRIALKRKELGAIGETSRAAYWHDELNRQDPALPEMIESDYRQFFDELIEIRSPARNLAAQAFQELDDFYETSNTIHLDNAIRLLTSAIQDAVADRFLEPNWAATLGAAYGERFQQLGRPLDLDMSIDLLETVLDHFAALPPGATLAYSSNLCASLLQRHQLSHSPRDLDQAVEIAEIILHEAEFSSPDFPGLIVNAVHAISARYETQGRFEDLERPIEVLRRLEGHSNRERHYWEGMATLGAILHQRFELFGGEDDLTEAARILTNVVHSTSPANPFRPSYVGSLGMALYRLGQKREDLGLLDIAISLLRPLCASGGRPELIRRNRASLANALFVRSTLSGDDSSIAEAEAIIGQVLADISDSSDPRLGDYASTVAAIMEHRARESGALEDLDKAVSWSRWALQELTEFHASRPALMRSLSQILRRRYLRTNQSADLDEGVAILQEAVESLRNHPPQQRRYLGYLAEALLKRHAYEGDPSDLTLAIDCLRKRLLSGDASSHDDLIALSHLMFALYQRYQSFGSLADLSEAWDAGGRAIQLIDPGDSITSGVLNNIVGIMATVSERSGDWNLLDVVVRALSSEWNYAEDELQRLAMASNLALSLKSRYVRTQSESDLQQALHWARLAAKEASNRGANAEGSGNALLIAGSVLSFASAGAGHQALLMEALSYFQASSRNDAASPALRLKAARRAGRCAMDLGEFRQGLQSYALAIFELLPAATWYGMTVTARAQLLRDNDSLASEAAYCALRADNPALAVQLLERGRLVILSSLLSIRSERDDLRASRPDLAGRLDEIGNVLNSEWTSDNFSFAWIEPINVDHAYMEDRSEDFRRRRAAARDWESCLREIRGLPGFANFLRPEPHEDFAIQVGSYPVVVVNVSEFGSHLVMLEPGGLPPIVRELPRCSLSEIRLQLAKLDQSVDRTADESLGFLDREVARHQLFDVLEWVWENICQDAMNMLDLSGGSRGVCWYPIGLACWLPLHAAGRHPRTMHQYVKDESERRETVLDQTISTYTPSLTSLARNTSLLSRDVKSRQLLIGVGHYPGLRPLRAVSEELALVEETSSSYLDATLLLDAQADRQSILDNMLRSEWLHIACHAEDQPGDVAQSGFHVWDGMLTLADLAGQPRVSRELAYLASCSTARGDRSLADEALHLAAALQLLGFEHVIASLWPVSDEAGPKVAELVYGRLARRRMDSRGTPEAVHLAVRRMRDDFASEPQIWAPYMHFGR